MPRATRSRVRTITVSARKSVIALFQANTGVVSIGIVYVPTLASKGIGLI